MKNNIFLLLFSVGFLLNYSDSLAQVVDPESNGLLDSLRKKEELGQDSMIITAKFIRYTTVGLLKDSTHTRQIDTTLRNFENYNLLYQPERPTINLGNVGLSYSELLFNPPKTIGFDAGFHALDVYLLRQDSIHYYRARSPYTELYYVNGGRIEQLFKVTHSQNIKSNWNFGANYFRNGSDGLYRNQKADHTNIAVFTWYESHNRRYNLLYNVLFNTLKAGENGSIIKDTIFTANETLRRDAEITRFSADGANSPKQTWRQRGFFLKQFYYIGKIDSSADASRISANQRVSYEINYTTDRYKFFRNEADVYNALPHATNDTLLLTNDSTSVKNLQNELMYSFYLRGKSLSFIKNELKLDLGLQHNIYSYEQMGYKTNFQNATLKASLGYRFSDRVNVTGNIRQIVYSKNSNTAGDYLYEAQTNFLLSRSVGRIILGAYLQNKSPEQVFERINYQYHVWDLNFEKTKISNLSVAYVNSKFRFSAKAEYYLLTNYLYFGETAVPREIAPQQAGSAINLLKINLRKDFKIGKFNIENYIVYQKSDFQQILRTPELYTYNSIYFADHFFNAPYTNAKVLYANIGFDVRFNTPFMAPSYSLNVSQFYNGPETKYATIPVVDLWIKATLRRANLFLKYDYANQGLFSKKGYYTVRQYPMPDALLKFGVSWKFYN